MKGIINLLAWAVVIFILFYEAWVNFGFFGIAIVIAAVFGVLYVVFRAQIMFLKGNARYNTNDKQGAFEIYEKAYLTGRLKPVNSLYYAYLLLRDGKIEKSEKMIDEISKKYKNVLLKNEKLSIRINKALIKWKKGDLKDAIADAEGIYNEGVKNTSLYGVLGYWYIIDKRYDDALKINEEAHEYNSSDLIIYDNLAQNYFLVGNKEKSEEMYKDILDKNPDFIEPYYNYGMLVLSNGDKEKAKEYFEKALSMEEKFLSTVTHDMVRYEIEKIS